jgi:hypothetical protein
MPSIRNLHVANPSRNRSAPYRHYQPALAYVRRSARLVDKESVRHYVAEHVTAEVLNAIVGTGFNLQRNSGELTTWDRDDETLRVVP